jgi:hypothetical protein
MTAATNGKGTKRQAKAVAGTSVASTVELAAIEFRVIAQHRNEKGEVSGQSALTGTCFPAHLDGLAEETRRFISLANERGGVPLDQLATMIATEQAEAS